MEGRSFLIHFIHPQPDDLPRDVLGLIVEVPVPEYDVDHVVPILYEELHYSTVDLDHIQKLTYIHRRAVSMDVYDIGNVRRLCQPIGNHECLIHHDEQVYDSAGSYFRVSPGNYIVLQIHPSHWRHRSMASSFHGLQTFTSDASQAILDPTDPYVIVRSTAVDQDNRPRGRRSLLLHQRYFADVNVIWHVTANLWTDQFGMDNMELFHSPSPSQLQDEAVHLIVTAGRRPATVPMMISYYMLPDDISLTVHLGSYALQMPTTTDYASIFAGISPHQDFCKISGADPGSVLEVSSPESWEKVLPSRLTGSVGRLNRDVTAPLSQVRQHRELRTSGSVASFKARLGGIRPEETLRVMLGPKELRSDYSIMVTNFGCTVSCFIQMANSRAPVLAHNALILFPCGALQVIYTSSVDASAMASTTRALMAHPACSTSLQEVYVPWSVWSRFYITSNLAKTELLDELRPWALNFKTLLFFLVCPLCMSGFLYCCQSSNRCSTSTESLYPSPVEWLSRFSHSLLGISLNGTWTLKLLWITSQTCFPSYPLHWLEDQQHLQCISVHF